jgi:hypothetical protein
MIPPGVTLPPSSILTLRLMYPTSSSKESIPPIILKVTLARNVDEGDDDDQTVVAPFYPHKSWPNWWLVVGDPTSQQLLVIKCVIVTQGISMVRNTAEKELRHTERFNTV